METNTEPVDPLSTNATVLSTQPEGMRIVKKQGNGCGGMHLFFVSGIVSEVVCPCAVLMLVYRTLWSTLPCTLNGMPQSWDTQFFSSF